ncbi:MULTISPECIES: hypothetical protein [unclassified Sinorhizobium]|uniref:hypothetical protein n=1 Tax=unclassified Sinorhizobium TaxID=2613772 RepID=UPI0024C3E3E5|nr:MULTISPECIES: hypothetical protein [unclassified Sinorhizobium]MDK1374446.1 hypothetical protein [Sinorhizobium sp. 6-70]MDK1482516.1 hypothetical protein [Sinorhizobium sp. 6-117]
MNKAAPPGYLGGALSQMCGSTRRVPDGEADEVPTHGISVGLRTIREARRCRPLLSGGGKKEALQRVATADGFTADWPATIVLECSDREILADGAAASL